MHENERKWILLKLSIEERDKVFVPLLSLSYPLRRRKNKRKEEKKSFKSWNSSEKRTKKIDVVFSNLLMNKYAFSPLVRRRHRRRLPFRIRLQNRKTTGR